MVNVVTSEGMQAFIESGKTEDIKPPEKIEQKSDDVSRETTEVKDNAVKAEDDDDKDLPERVRQQIGKKHRAMKEAEEFAEREYNQRRAAEKQADQFKSERDALAKRFDEIEQKSRPAVVMEAPKQSDFATVDEYLDAKTDYLVDQKLKKQEVAQQERIANEKARQTQNEFAKSIEEAVKKYPDFQEVTEAADFQTPDHITQYLLESDTKAELGYHLSLMFRDDPAELNRILKLSPIRAIAELGKMEVRISKPIEKHTDKTPISKAPAPITPLSNGPADINADLNRDMPYAEYKRLKELQRKGK